MSQKAPTTQTYLSIAGSTIPAWRSLLEQEYGRTLKSLTTLQGGTPPPTPEGVPAPADLAMQAPVPEVAMPTPAPTLEELRTAVQDFGRESPSDSGESETSDAERVDASEAAQRDATEEEATTEMSAESDKYFDTPEE